MKTFSEYQLAALRTAPEDMLQDLDLQHGAMGVCTEGGELLDVVKKNIFYRKSVDFVNVKEEIGDVLWYLALLARACDTTLDEIAAINIAKLRKRYPEKFTEEAALNRDLAAEREVLECGATLLGKPSALPQLVIDEIVNHLVGRNCTLIEALHELGHDALDRDLVIAAIEDRCCYQPQVRAWVVVPVHHVGYRTAPKDGDVDDIGAL